SQDYSGGAQIHCQPMDRFGATRDFLSVKENAVAIAGNRRVKLESWMAGRQFERVTFDAHLTSPHRVATDSSGFSDDSRATREAEIFLEMLFGRCFR